MWERERERETERDREREVLNRNKTRLVQSRCCAEEGLRDIYPAPQHIRRMSGSCSTHGVME